jgi:hypothetical protein
VCCNGDFENNQEKSNLSSITATIVDGDDVDGFCKRKVQGREADSPIFELELLASFCKMFMYAVGIYCIRWSC